ncbi:MAG: protein kinase [Planctomycetaceae bacterium]|jgi:serine/threonine protein kinase|nr:protein kinase [Planctomycetaceae bacterium]
MLSPELRNRYRLLLQEYRSGNIDMALFQAELTKIRSLGAEAGAAVDDRVVNHSNANHSNFGMTVGKLPPVITSESSVHQRKQNPFESSVVLPRSGCSFRHDVQIAPTRLQHGDLFGDIYTLERLLGYGHLGEVWQARERANKHEVVVKVISREVQDSSDFQRFAIPLFRSIVNFRSRNLCPMFRIATDAEYGYYTVSAFIDAVNLDEYYSLYVEKFGSFSIDALLTILKPVGKTLDSLHAAQLTHCGLYPRNVMIGRRCGVQITDVALTEIARVMMKQANAATAPSEVIPFQAPEVVLDQAYSAFSDQYSLALIAYRLLVGEVPHGKLSEDLPKMASLPQGIAHAILRAVSQKPDERFANCSDFVDAIGKGKHTNTTLWTPRTSIEKQTIDMGYGYGESYPYRKPFRIFGSKFYLSATAIIAIGVVIGIAVVQLLDAAKTDATEAPEETMVIESNEQVRQRVEFQKLLSLSKSDDDALRRVGDYYLLGIAGVERDLSRAVKYYTESAEHGNAQAAYQVGRCYEEGIGVAKNEKEAVKWYQIAAKYNEPNAIFRIGLCYAKGKGIEKNEVEARRNISKAARLGQREAQKYRP